MNDISMDDRYALYFSLWCVPSGSWRGENQLGVEATGQGQGQGQGLTTLDNVTLTLHTMIASFQMYQDAIRASIKQSDIIELEEGEDEQLAEEYAILTTLIDAAEAILEHTEA
jgi:hypothetical protein